MILILFRNIYIKYVLLGFLGCRANLDEPCHNKSLSDEHEIEQVTHCPSDAEVLFNGIAHLVL